MAKANKAAKAKALVEAKEHNDAQVVKMKFSEDKFYNDFTKAHFEAGKVYEVKGADMIQRWLKRGGEIVSGELTSPKIEDNSSVVVENQHSESSPLGSKQEPIEPESDPVDTIEDPSDSDDNQQDEE